MILHNPTCMKYLMCDCTDYDDWDAFFQSSGRVGKETNSHVFTSDWMMT